jgi:transcription initiation factor IIE alpha subunit
MTIAATHFYLQSYFNSLLLCMQKLIEIKESEMIVCCDNKNCTYVLLQKDAKENNITLEMLVDQTCPRCGENLLTKEDYITYKRFMNAVDRINKWLSWLTFFYRKKIVAKDGKVYSVHIHNGVNIEENKN